MVLSAKARQGGSHVGRLLADPIDVLAADYCMYLGQCAVADAIIAQCPHDDNRAYLDGSNDLADQNAIECQERSIRRHVARIWLGCPTQELQYGLSTCTHGDSFLSHCQAPDSDMHDTCSQNQSILHNEVVVELPA